MLKSLPHDILLYHILPYLYDKDVRAFLSTCRQFRFNLCPDIYTFWSHMRRLPPVIKRIECPKCYEMILPKKHISHIQSCNNRALSAKTRAYPKCKTCNMRVKQNMLHFHEKTCGVKDYVIDLCSLCKRTGARRILTPWYHDYNHSNIIPCQLCGVYDPLTGCVYCKHAICKRKTCRGCGLKNIQCMNTHTCILIAHQWIRIIATTIYNEDLPDIIRSFFLYLRVSDKSDRYIICKNLCYVLPLTVEERENQTFMTHLMQMHKNDVIYMVKAEATSWTQGLFLYRNLNGWVFISCGTISTPNEPPILPE
jgi:hypothetical protein